MIKKYHKPHSRIISIFFGMRHVESSNAFEYLMKVNGSMINHMALASTRFQMEKSILVILKMVNLLVRVNGHMLMEEFTTELGLKDHL